MGINKYTQDDTRGRNGMLQHTSLVNTTAMASRPSPFQECPVLRIIAHVQHPMHAKCSSMTFYNKIHFDAKFQARKPAISALPTPNAAATRLARAEMAGASADQTFVTSALTDGDLP